MSNFSQFTGGATPVGGVVMMPESTSVDQFTSAGQTFLRTGKLATYTSSYATAAANGQAYKQWGVSVYNNNVNPSGNASIVTSYATPTTAPYMTYALGVWGMMTPITQAPVSTANTFPQAFTFSGEGVGLRSPVILRMPPPQLQMTSSTGVYVDFRSMPTYMSGPGLWVFVELVFTNNAQAGTNRTAAGINVYSSKSGSNWKRVYVPWNSSFLGTNLAAVGSFLMSACSANSIFISTTGNNGTTGYPTIVQIGLSKNGDTATWIGGAYTATTNNVPILMTVSATEVLTGVTNGTNYIFNALTDNSLITPSTLGTGDYTLTTGPYWCFTRNSTTMVFFASYGNVVKVGTTLAGTLRSTAKTISGQSAPAAAVNNGAYAAWTGAYFIIYAESSSGTNAYQVYYSTDGNAWTAVNNTYNVQVYKPSFNGNTGMFWRNHVLTYNGTNWNIWSFPANNILATAPASMTGVPNSNANSLLEFVTFNSNLYAIESNNVVVRFDSNLFSADLVTYNTSATGITISQGSRLKVVNGRLFVINTVNNFLFHSADGTTWTQVQITAIGSIKDIEYIGTNWVVIGSVSSNNAAYSSNLTSWTGVNIAAASTGYGLLNVGTALVGFTASGVRRSTDGVTWNTVTGSFNVTTAAFSEYFDSTTSTAYVYVGGTPPTATTRYASTDAGVTWTSSSIAPPPSVPGTTSPVPFGFIRFNNTNYCIIGYPSSGASSSIPSGSTVATTTDFSTFTPVQVAIPFGNVTALSALDSNTLVGVGNYGVSNNNTSLPINQYGGPLINVIEAVGSASFVGTDTEVAQAGGVGYLRIA